MNKVHVQPFAIRIGVCVLCLAFFVADDFFLNSVHKEYASRLQAGFYFYVFFRYVKHSYFAAKD